MLSVVGDSIRPGDILLAMSQDEVTWGNLTLLNQQAFLDLIFFTFISFINFYTFSYVESFSHPCFENIYSNFQVPVVRLCVVKIVESVLSTSGSDRQLEMFNLFSSAFKTKCQVRCL